MAKAIGWEGALPAVAAWFKPDSKPCLDATARVMDGLKLTDVGLTAAA
jgi:hypothetical protein